MTIKLPKGFEPVNLFRAAADAKQGNGWAALLYEVGGKPHVAICYGESLEVLAHVMQWQADLETNPAAPQPARLSEAVNNALRNGTAALLSEYAASAMNSTEPTFPMGVQSCFLMREPNGTLKPVLYTWQGRAPVHRVLEALAERERLESNPGALLTGATA